MSRMFMKCIRVLCKKLYAISSTKYFTLILGKTHCSVLILENLKILKSFIVHSLLIVNLNILSWWYMLFMNEINY